MTGFSPEAFRMSLRSVSASLRRVLSAMPAKNVATLCLVGTVLFPAMVAPDSVGNGISTNIV
jgi:hypothetical protein